MMTRNISIILLAVFILFYGCKSDGSKGNGGLDMPAPTKETGALEVANETMENIVDNISSPIEMAALIKSLGVPFSKKYMAPTNNADRFISGSRKAFNLGIYGSDLGYLNMNGKTSSVLDYLTVIKSLADGIQVGQFFDFPTLKRLATNNENIDSLVYISVHSFNQIDKYLRENKRGNLSALMITGVWVEGLYLATQVAKETENPELAQKIGEQKIMLENLMLLLRNFKNDSYITSIIEDMEKIKAVYKGISIRTEWGEPEAIEENGELVIIQNEKSIVEISPEQLQNIIKTTEEIRNKLISL